jgi:sugar/nucleoside kinase (ribokinase family)
MTHQSPIAADKQIDIACVGILCADVLAKTVDRLPDRGRLMLLDQLQMHIGGCAANAAIDLAKLGMRAAIVGKIGGDGFGSFLSSGLSAEGVDVRGLKVGGTPSSASVVTIGSDGERSILHCLGANGEFCYEDIDGEVIGQAGIVFVAGTFLMPSFDGPGAEKLLRTAKECGALCCMDTAWDSTGRWMDCLRGCMPYLDWFLPSMEEAAALSGETDPVRMAERFREAGAANVAIKLGADGCYVKPCGEDGFFVPAYHNIAVVDTSGAGDAWCAGFLAGLAKGWPPRRCAQFANATGAHCVMAIGTTTGIRSMEDIQAYINTHEAEEKVRNADND